MSRIIKLNDIKGKAISLDLIINKFLLGDVLEGLRLIPDESVSLIFTSPPYNVKLNYGNSSDNDIWQEYLDWLFKVWTECARVLRPGGRLVINIDSIANHDEDKVNEYFRPIYADLVNQMKKIPDMNFRCDICWYKHQVVGRATAWGSYMSCSCPIIRRNHEYLLVWSKGDWSLSGNAEESDMTDEEFQQWTMSMWSIVPETKKRAGHPAPFPEELAKRVIKIYTYRDDLVLDPFSGTGTTACMAAAHKRRFIGIDNCEEYVDYSASRIKKFVVDIFQSYQTRSERIKSNQKSKKQSEKEKVDIFNAG